MQGPLLYRLLRPMARLLARLFHRRLDVEHAERVPARGPLVFAANHPNMMLDVLLLSISQPRPLHFLAKATLFDNAVLERVLKATGVLPVYRKRDRPTEMGKNVLTFEACHELLARGGAIAIFPEGLSHGREAILPLRTGCARITLEAEAKRASPLGVRIVPVGLSFSSRELFRRDALIRFGEPIDPTRYLAMFRHGDPKEAVRHLTRELEGRLRELVLHVPEEDDEVLVSHLRRFFVDSDGPMGARLAVDRTLLDAIQRFREQTPLRYRRLRRELLSYGRALDRFGLTNDRVGREYRFWPAARYVAPRLLAAVAGALPFLYGAVNHYLPYKIPGWVARTKATHVVERATIKFLFGLVVFPLFYAAQTSVVGYLLGARFAWLYLASLPLSGLFALLYWESLSSFFHELRAFFFQATGRDTARRLASWRNGLAQELAVCRDEYEALVGTAND